MDCSWDKKTRPRRFLSRIHRLRVCKSVRPSRSYIIPIDFWGRRLGFVFFLYILSKFFLSLIYVSNRCQDQILILPGKIVRGMLRLSRHGLHYESVKLGNRPGLIEKKPTLCRETEKRKNGKRNFFFSRIL